MNDVTTGSAAAGFLLRKPYLLFIGDAQDAAEAKTAFGLRDWARDACVAQLGCRNRDSTSDYRT